MSPANGVSPKWIQDPSEKIASAPWWRRTELQTRGGPHWVWQSIGASLSSCGRCDIRRALRDETELTYGLETFALYQYCTGPGPCRSASISLKEGYQHTTPTSDAAYLSRSTLLTAVFLTRCLCAAGRPAGWQTAVQRRLLPLTGAPSPWTGQSARARTHRHTSRLSYHTAHLSRRIVSEGSTCTGDGMKVTPKGHSQIIRSRWVGQLTSTNMSVYFCLILLLDEGSKATLSSNVPFVPLCLFPFLRRRFPLETRLWW